MRTTFCLINVSGCSTYSSVHCRRECPRLQQETLSVGHRAFPVAAADIPGEQDWRYGSPLPKRSDDDDVIQRFVTFYISALEILLLSHLLTYITVMHGIVSNDIVLSSSE